MPHIKLIWRFNQFQKKKKKKIPRAPPPTYLNAIVLGWSQVIAYF